MKLNIGCGFDIKEGFINMDISKEVNPNIVHDLNNIPYPFKDNTFDYILAKDVLEHVPKINLIFIIEELYRISKDKCLWNITVPFYNNRLANANIIHYTGFDFGSFDMFTEGANLESIYSKVKLNIKSENAMPTGRGRFIPFKMFFRHMIGELYNVINFKIEVIKK